jgi:hypothetical protein
MMRSALRSLLYNRISEPEPYGVREAGWISLSGCHPNRLQDNPDIFEEAIARC